jgi:hypothetical protein
MEAARLGEPCTEEELRLAIVSMRATLVFAHLDHARWASDETSLLLLGSKQSITGKVSTLAGISH